MKYHQPFWVGFMLLSVFILSFTPLDWRNYEPERRRKILPWQDLKNPVYSHPDWSVKDACMAYRDGWYYLFFSAFYFEEGRERSHVVGVKTKDFKTFSEPLFNWRGQEEGWIGMCSPNLTKVGTTYYLTYNSWGDKKDQPNQLFYATSTDLEHWEPGKPLARNVTEGVRSIDAAMAFHRDKYYVIWKKEQLPQVAVASSLDSKEWITLGRPAERWFENAELLHLHGKWHMLVTASGHKPHLAAMRGTGDQDQDWLSWEEFKPFDIPEETFNTDNRANAAFLADWREQDGYYYLLYAGRTEKLTHRGRGDNKLGLARSKDLTHWSVPPQEK